MPQSINLWSWGWQADGMLGHVDRQDRPAPECIGALRTVAVVSVAAAAVHAVALTEQRSRDTSSCGRTGEGTRGHTQDLGALDGVRTVAIAARAKASWCMCTYCGCASSSSPPRSEFENRTPRKTN
mmetsp:Transcript_9157/g.30346  ORF Transcript_9157/g.30346 Transcript_9157/m.30346 type:complete len:126 (+) Transcript_9157:84-461(+)|eukprot:scaffold7283_cov124-Isochrysis_galbana.AAC.3